MDWTKIKTKHYINSGLTFTQRGYHGTFCALVAHLEKYPNDRQLSETFGKNYRKILDKFPKIFGISAEKIGEKVVEDVLDVRRKKEKSKESSDKYREKKQKGDGHGDHHVTTQRREEKRIGEKYQATPGQSNNSKPEKTVDNPKMVDLKDIKIWDLSEPGKHKIYNLTIKIFKARGWPTHDEFIKTIFCSIARRIAFTNKPKSIYPYFNKAVQDFISKNADQINALAKKKHKKDMSIGNSKIIAQMANMGKKDNVEV